MSERSETTVGSSTRFAAAGLTLALVVVAVAMELTGTEPVKTPTGIPDPGLLVGWLVPTMTTLSTIASVATVGMLMVAVFLLPSGRELEGLSVRAVRLAARWSAAWAVFAAVAMVVDACDTLSKPLSGMDLNQLGSYITQFAPGAASMLEILVAVYVAVICRWTLHVHTLAITIGVALAGVGFPALSSHASAAGNHDLAVPALLAHALGITVWVGGLLALGWVSLRGSKRLTPAVERYSVMALWAYGVVAVSGLTAAWVNLGGLSHLDSAYGALVIAKVVLLVALGGFGVAQRRRLAAGTSRFVTLAISELAVMFTAVAIGVVLSRTATPLGDDVLSSAAERLIGEAVPPAPTPWRIAFGFNPNGFGLAIIIFGTLFYGLGLRIMHRRGDAWPVGRTISWFFGLVVIAWATFGGLGRYALVMFSYHMVSHMMLAMVAPIFIVLGAPVTLALRTLPGPRRQGENSPRGLLTWLLHSWIGRLYTHPVIAAGNFVISLYAIYFTGLFQSLMSSHWGHMFMELHFLVSGVLFFYVIIGVDPAPRRLPPVARMGLLLVTIPAHAFFAVTLMAYKTVLAKDYFETINRPYHTNLLHDQFVGAGFAWAVSEIPTLVVILVLLVQWYRQDTREAARKDRAASRDHDAELRDYNDYLKSLQDEKS